MQNNQNKLDKYRVPEDIVFGKKWFEKHQSKLLWFLNAPVIKYWFRWVMRIKSYDCQKNVKITNIQPSNFSYGDRYIKKGKKILLERTTDFRTHDKYAKRLYFAFKYMWWAMHAFDWVLLDRVEAMAKLSFGFSTLTAYPDAGTGATTVVGGVLRQNVSETWATIIAGAGTGTYLSQDDGNTYIIHLGTDAGYNNKFSQLRRTMATYDTSGLGSTANISAAILSFYGLSKYKDGSWPDTTDVDIYTATPASDNTLVNADFQQVGSTSQTGGAVITYANWSTTGYNDFTFDATGRGNISKTGISKFATRNANYEVAASTPPNGDSNVIQMKTYYSDHTGTSLDPKLVVTYSTSTAYTTELTEVITLVDTITKQTSKPLTEVVTLVDIIIKSTARTLVDVVTLVDTITKITSRAFTEVVTLVDTSVKQIARTLTEEITLVDTVTKAMSRTLSEVVTLVDVVIKQGQKVFTEAVTLADTIVKQTTKVLADTVTIVDVFASSRIYFKELLESVTIVDTVIKQTTRVFTEVVTLVDTITRQISTTYTETITLVDSIVKTISKELTETVTVVDTFIRNLTRTFVETITLNDTVVKQVEKVLTDTITVVDNFVSALFTKAKRGIVVLLSRVQDKNVIQSKNKDKTIL